MKYFQVFFFFIYFDFLSFQDYTYSIRENENCHFEETIEEQNLSVYNFSLFGASNKEGSMAVAILRLYKIYGFLLLLNVWLNLKNHILKFYEFVDHPASLIIYQFPLNLQTSKRNDKRND